MFINEAAGNPSGDSKSGGERPKTGRKFCCSGGNGDGLRDASRGSSQSVASPEIPIADLLPIFEIIYTPVFYALIRRNLPGIVWQG